MHCQSTFSCVNIKTKIKTKIRSLSRTKEVRQAREEAGLPRHSSWAFLGCDKGHIDKEQEGNKFSYK